MRQLNQMESRIFNEEIIPHDEKIVVDFFKEHAGIISQNKLS